MLKKSAVLKAVLAASLILSFARFSQALSPEAEKRKLAGNEYQKRREYQEARLQYMEALRLEPDYADAHYNLGMLYFYRLKDYSRALYHLNIYRRLETGATDMGQIYSHISQALEHIEATEREDYKSAILAGTVDAYEKFLTAHPVGYYADKAREEMKRLLKYQDEKTKRESMEHNAYVRAVATGTVAAFDKFLADYPTSPNADEARDQRMRLMERNLQERLAFEKASNEDTADALEEFARAYPSGDFTEKAKSRAAHLKAAEESLALARETGSVAAMTKYLEIFSDTPYSQKAKEILEEFRKAEVEKAAAAEAMKIISTKPAPAEAAAPKQADKKDAPARETTRTEPQTVTAAPATPAAPPQAAQKEASAQQVGSNGAKSNGNGSANGQEAKASEGGGTGNAKPPEELTPQESEAKRRAESRERARRMMEAEIKRMNEQKQLQQTK